MSEEKKKRNTDAENEQKNDGSQAGKPNVSETWAEETIADLDEFIESQGIYIRQ